MNAFEKPFKTLALVSGLLIGMTSLQLKAQTAAGDQPPKPNATMQSRIVKVTTITELNALYPPNSITTLEVAKRAGDDANTVRTAIDTQFVSEQNGCYPKFFAAACLSEVKERHRLAIAEVRRIEIEANKFKRRANALERDNALEEKHEKEAADLLKHDKEKEDAASAEADKAGEDNKTPASDSQSQRNSSGKRADAHRAAVMKRDAEEAANAIQRAKNISAYERKTQEAEERQRAIAAKKLEKARAESNKATSETK